MTVHYIWKNSGVQTTEKEFFPDGQLWVFTTFAVTTPNESKKFAVLALNEHIQRLFHDATRCNIALNLTLAHQSHFKSSLIKLLLQESTESGPLRVRLVIRRDDEILINFRPLNINNLDSLGISAITVYCKREMPEVKSSVARRMSLIAQQEANESGSQEALLVDSLGIVREGAWSNIFWFDNQGKLFTTKSDVLPGVTRSIILSLVPCILHNATLDELFKSAKELLITKSTTGITPVISVNNQQIGNGSSGANTKKLCELYNKYALINAIHLEYE